MGSFFNIDNPFFTIMNKICDIIMLSVVYTICCIPIITIGPATTALYYAVVKVIRRERGYLFREYFKSFKENFKTGVFVTLILLVAFGILYVDKTYVGHMDPSQQTMAFAMNCLFNAIGIILILTMLYAFPVLSRFTVKGFQVFKTAFFMAVRHLPTTVFVAVIFIAVLLGIYLLPIGFGFAPALGCLLISFFMEHVFKKYMPAPDPNAEEAGTDEWYLE